MIDLPRNVYRHRGGYRGQRMIAGRAVRTAPHETPQLAAAALEAMVAGAATDPEAVDVVAELEAADHALEQAGQAVRRAMLGTHARKRRPRGAGKARAPR